MTALLYKDFRLNRLILLLGILLLIAPLIVFTSLNAYSRWQYGDLIRPWYVMFNLSATLSLMLSLITITLLGGTAFAAERADRSAEFLAYLPPTRIQIVLSKLTLALSAVLLIWLLNLLSLYVFAPLSGEIYPELAEELREFRSKLLPPLAATSILMFGAAWLGSAFLPSHNIAAGLAFGVPVLVFGILRTIEFILDHNEFATNTYPATAITLGLAAFLAGITIYLSRVEP